MFCILLDCSRFSEREGGGVREDADGRGGVAARYCFLWGSGGTKMYKAEIK